ncbi:MAG: RNA pseudouridine synthase [Clostridiales bacterium]|nr:RNA pseudouridine synthase [Clostridiales bacterium]
MKQSTPTILYEDNHLLVVIKPPNLPVQADASGDLDLLTLCKAYIGKKYGKPGAVYLGLVHRLDRPVGGVMVFARTGKAAQRLAAQFAGRQAQKRYLAIVDGLAPAKGTLTDWLLKDEKTNNSGGVPEGTSGAKLATLHFRRIAHHNNQSLVDIRLDTGRPHQIRVQFSHAGIPLHADMRYNKNVVVGEQIRLWAYALTITHPTLGDSMSFYAQPLFREFPAQLALLPAYRVCDGVYVDDDIVVVDKHAGVESESELPAQLEPLLGTLYPVHRLDANTEGLLIFARNEAMQNAIEDAFRRRETRKIYHALLCGTPNPREASLTHHARKDAAHALMQLCPADAPGATEMRLSYRVLEERGDLALCEITLDTGRTHQIRLQMSAIGHPVLGDDKYGNREINKAHRARRQQLLAKELGVLGRTFVSEKEM